MIVARDKKLTGLFVVLSILYLVLSIVIRPDRHTLAHYHITSAQDAALTFTITIPFIIIWTIALVAYLRFQAYTDTIKSGKDGKAFNTIRQGLLLLSLWLPLSTLISTVVSDYYRSHTSSTDILVNVSNYANIIILFFAFLLIYKGSAQLLDVIKKVPPRMPQFSTFLYIAFAAFYVFLVLHDPARQFPGHNVKVAAYYLPDWLILLLIIIPRLYTWHLGLQAIYNIFLYRKFVKGPIYKQALGYLTAGLSGVIAMIVVLRCFESLSSEIANFSLGLILLLVYVLLILIAVGYYYIAKGAKNLQKIEEI